MSDARTPARRKKWIIALIAVIAVGGGLYYWLRPTAPTVTYREAAVEKGDIRLSILATGTVQPENRLEIKPPIAGRAEEVLVKEGQRVNKGQILAWMSSTERAALLDAARAQGAAELRRWEELYRPTPVVAPIDGRIILRNIESGQTFASTDPILVMSDRLVVQAQVDETDIAQVRLRQRAEIELDAYPGRKIPGKVELIAFEAKTVNNVTTYSVDVRPSDTPAFMRAGMTANVSFVVEAKDGVLLVPTESVKLKESGAMVLVKDGEGQPVPRRIAVGVSDGKRTEVLSGLSEGETVMIAQVASSSKPMGSSPFSTRRRSSSSSGSKSR